MSGLTDRIPADLAARYRREERQLFEKACFHTFETNVPCTDGKGGPNIDNFN